MFRLCFCIVNGTNFFIISWIQSEMISFTPVFVACSLCLYECIDSELETTYKQATTTTFTQKFCLEECLGQRENFIMFRFF